MAWIAAPPGGRWPSRPPSPGPWPAPSPGPWPSPWRGPPPRPGPELGQGRAGQRGVEAQVGDGRVGHRLDHGEAAAGDLGHGVVGASSGRTVSWMVPPVASTRDTFGARSASRSGSPPRRRVAHADAAGHRGDADRLERSRRRELADVGEPAHAAVAAVGHQEAAAGLRRRLVGVSSRRRSRGRRRPSRAGRRRRCRRSRAGSPGGSGRRRRRRRGRRRSRDRPASGEAAGDGADDAVAHPAHLPLPVSAIR